MLPTLAVTVYLLESLELVGLYVSSSRTPVDGISCSPVVIPNTPYKVQLRTARGHNPAVRIALHAMRGMQDYTERNTFLVRIRQQYYVIVRGRT